MSQIRPDVNWQVPQSRRLVGAIAGGLLAGVSVAFWRVHDLSSLSEALHHLARDWYELLVFLLAAAPIFYWSKRRID